MAKRAEERARAARIKEEQAKPPPSEVDESKRKLKRAGGPRAGWGSGVGEEEEESEEGGAELEAVDPAAKAAASRELGITVAHGRDAKEEGFATGFLSELVGMEHRGYNSDRIRGLIAWEVEDLEGEGVTEDPEEAPAPMMRTAPAPPARPPPKPVAEDPHRSRAVPFQPKETAGWDPRTYRRLPPSWMGRIPRAGMPTVKSEPASDAIEMFE